MAAARELFVNNGYSATSITDIVERAGTSVGLPYYHFGSKEKIFLAIWEEYQAAQEVRTRAAVAQARNDGKPGSEALLAGLRAYLEGAWAEHEIQPLIHQSDKPAGFDTITRAANARYLRQNERLLAHLGERKARIASVFVAASTGGLCLELARCKSNRAARALIDTGLELFSGMLRTAEADPVPGSADA